jgi:hypothetical protein
MPTEHATAPPPAQPTLDGTDRALAPLVRDWFEHDLRERVDAAMDRQLAVYLAGELSRERHFVTAA